MGCAGRRPAEHPPGARAAENFGKIKPRMSFSSQNFEHTTNVARGQRYGRERCHKIRIKGLRWQLYCNDGEQRLRRGCGDASRGCKGRRPVNGQHCSICSIGWLRFVLPIPRKSGGVGRPLRRALEWQTGLRALRHAAAAPRAKILSCVKKSQFGAPYYPLPSCRRRGSLHPRGKGRTRPPCVAISSPRNGLRRSKRVS